MKSISQKLQDDIRAIMEAGLHPNQQKIDVHEPEKDKITAHDFKKLRSMKKTPDGKVHNCATHVEHAVLGKGTTVSEDHAEPDAEGNIEWYTVQFEHSTQKVLTKDLTITMSEAHMHESSEEQFDEEEKKKPVSPFDYKNYKSEIPRKPGELTGHDSKKISTGTVYTKKPVKEAMSHQAKTTMKHIPNASPAMKKAAKDIKPGIAGYKDRVDMLKAGGVKEDSDLGEARKLEGTYTHTNGHQSKVYKLSGEHNEGDPYHVKLFKGGKHYEPADYFTNDKEDAHSTAKHMVKEEASKESKKDFQDRQQRLATAGAETAKDPARLKRMSNIPGYSAAMDLAKKTTKEEVEQEEYTFADYLEAARAKYVDEDAVLVANEAFKNKDITLFIDQSQSSEA